MNAGKAKTCYCLFRARTKETEERIIYHFPETLSKQRNRAMSKVFLLITWKRNGASIIQPMHALHAESDRHTQKLCVYLLINSVPFLFPSAS